MPKSRNGSEAALTGPKRGFRFASINGRQSTGSAGQFRANDRLMHRNKATLLVDHLIGTTKHRRRDRDA
jgi:hypothetical protein